MTRYPQLDLDSQLCYPLYAASRAFVRAYGPLLEPFGLTYPQYLTMMALWSGPDDGQTVGQVGKRLRLDSGTLTPLLKRLEAAGFVTRQRDPDDERRVIILLTTAGDALQDEVAHVPSALANTVGLTQKEGIALRTMLDRLLDGIDKSRDST